MPAEAVATRVIVTRLAWQRSLTRYSDSPTVIGWREIADTRARYLAAQRTPIV